MSRALLLLSSLALASLAVACGHDEGVSPTPVPTVYAGTLDVDIRGHAQVTLTIPPSGAPSVELLVDSVNAADIVDAKTKLSTAARVERFPENESELYTAKLSQPAQTGGPCGADPISLGLSLHRRAKVTRVGGSLAVYCGKDRFSGVPLRILRLTGDLPAK